MQGRGGELSPIPKSWNHSSWPVTVPTPSHPPPAFPWLEGWEVGSERSTEKKTLGESEAPSLPLGVIPYSRGFELEIHRPNSSTCKLGWK